MTLADLKILFRSKLKKVLGGPPVGTVGQNRTEGLWDCLDAVAEYAGELAGQGGGVTPTQLATVATTLPATAERTAAYTLALADAGCQVPVNVAGAVAVTIPAEADVAFPVGTILEVAQEGTGQLTVAGAAGVTVQAPGGAVKTGGQYAVVGLRKKAANVWRVQGGVS